MTFVSCCVTLSGTVHDPWISGNSPLSYRSSFTFRIVTYHLRGAFRPCLFVPEVLFSKSYFCLTPSVSTLHQ